MTAIAFKDGIMAADSMAWTGTNQGILEPVRPKIVRLKDGSLLACCGSSDEIEWWRDHMLNDVAAPSFERDASFGALWAKTDGTLWHCGHRQKWYERCAPVALGANESFLLGAMHAGASAQQAVRLAIELTDGAGGDVQVEVVGSVDDAGDIISVSRDQLRVYGRN